MNTVLIIPTGIGAEIGGHSGDANVIAKLIGSVSNKLITHPNVVNASDINEMPNNTLYVEGSMLDRFLEGDIELQEVRKNKILLVCNKPVSPETINAVSAGRVTLGAEIEILELETPLKLIGQFENGKAKGYVTGWKELVNQVKNYDFDALAITTPIEINKPVALNYLNTGGVNPWGGVEAICSKLISKELNKPVAHSPMETEQDSYLVKYSKTKIVDPRMSAEMVSVCFLQCILKGLHKAPRIGKGLSYKDVDVMISPYGCWGRPHEACRKNNIPIIVVRNNKTVLNDGFPEKTNIIFVENYLEAVGVIQAMKNGISLESMERPIKPTKIL